MGRSDLKPGRGAAIGGVPGALGGGRIDLRVEVPAGKFRAFRIEVDIDNQGRPGRSVLWYDARVGVVRMEHEAGDSSYIRILKSFKPGGK